MNSATPAEPATAHEEGMLPPYSDTETTCPKCAHGLAHTAYRSAAGSRPILLVEWNGATVHRGPLPERLERECQRCGFQWDEALCPPACGMTVEALAYAVDNATPYPVDLDAEVCTYIARYLLGCLYVEARPDHPLWQYSAGRPSPPVHPQPAETCPASAPAPALEEDQADGPVTVQELADALHAVPQAPPAWGLGLSPGCALHMAEQLWKTYILTRRPAPAGTA